MDTPYVIALITVPSQAIGQQIAKQFVPTVHAIHPYETPEIIALPILMGFPDYLNWIEQETR